MLYHVIHLYIIWSGLPYSPKKIDSNEWYSVYNLFHICWHDTQVAKAGLDTVMPGIEVEAIELLQKAIIDTKFESVMDEMMGQKGVKEACMEVAETIVSTGMRACNPGI